MAGKEIHMMNHLIASCKRIIKDTSIVIKSTGRSNSAFLSLPVCQQLGTISKALEYRALTSNSKHTTRNIKVKKSKNVEENRILSKRSRNWISHEERRREVDINNVMVCV